MTVLQLFLQSTKLRTTTKPKTLNPSWCETLVYHCVTDDDVIRKVLRLSVYDEDPIGSDFIGETRVPLRTLKPGVPRDYNVYLSGLQVNIIGNEPQIYNISRLFNVIVFLVLDPSNITVWMLIFLPAYSYLLQPCILKILKFH